MGIADYEAKRYQGRVKNDGILLSVHLDNSDRSKRGQRNLEARGRAGHLIDR
jgi:hypothetical protein